ncbi:MAG TPA: Asp-tRNA(Asn)/Glu-tRNA(Gln) amidotransferase subunit GatB [Gemmatimonadales bacterium]|nr:Asp-tRNA(Asn)/Glu-tRNA(Gln) amidotransferase subunit GatB [Gemmatimonadales bacterium]
MTWETVIGLEVHVQLLTRTKMFCGCSTKYGDPPNTNVCPVCLGMPGALPVPNEQAVRLAARAAFALGCTVHARSVFARKNYFYPDLPKGYQISQYDRPLATGGSLEILSPERGVVSVGITRLHLEEDAGKSFHDRFPGATAVDFNRSGVPLIEIVSAPDLRSPAEARAYLTALKQVLRWLGVSDCNMEEGSLRVDANVSIRRPGEPLGTRTEVKNMNSFSGVERALTIERDRQVRVLESGGVVEQRTMTYDAARGEVRPMRSKEESHDYRYFPEPDLPPLVLQEPWLRAEREGLPELPAAMRARFQEQYALTPSEAAVVTATAQLAGSFERLVAMGPQFGAKEIWNWVANDLLALSADGESLPDIAPERVLELIAMVKAGELSRQAAKKVLTEMTATPEPPRAIADRLGLVQVQDSAAIESWVAETLAAHPAEVERYRAGEQKLLGFLVGQAMKRSKGKADPRAVGAALERALSS